MRGMGRVELFLIGMLSCGLAANEAWGLKSDPRDRWPSPRERGAYQARIASSGKVLWTVEWRTSVTEEADHKRVEIQEEGRGQPWRYAQPVTWKKQMIFHTPPAEASGNGPPAPAVFVQSVKGFRWSEGGQLLGELRLERDEGNRKIHFKDHLPGGRLESAVLPWTPQSLPDEMLFHWARTLPFEEERQKAASQCTLLVSPRRQFRMNARIRGREVITTPAGTFPCYRVELYPELVGPLKAFAPRMVLWCTTDPPHRWVRYRGPVGGPGSPEAVIELVRFEEEPG